jgi:hypothetical protein
VVDDLAVDLALVVVDLRVVLVVVLLVVLRVDFAEDALLANNSNAVESVTFSTD